jgi:hypothetical protein
MTQELNASAAVEQKAGGISRKGLSAVLGMTILLVGFVIMIVQSRVRPAFFRGETLSLAAPRFGELEE